LAGAKRRITDAPPCLQPPAASSGTPQTGGLSVRDGTSLLADPPPPTTKKSGALPKWLREAGHGWLRAGERYRLRKENKSLREANEILKKRRSSSRKMMWGEGGMKKYLFVFIFIAILSASRFAQWGTAASETTFDSSGSYISIMNYGYRNGYQDRRAYPPVKRPDLLPNRKVKLGKLFAVNCAGTSVHRTLGK
jgi:hypothetical protein